MQGQLARARPLVAWALSRLGFYAGAMLENAHFRYQLVNFLAGPLPEFASGTIRARGYRWAGFDFAGGCAVAGNLRLTSGMSGFYDKLHVGRETVIAPEVTINLDETVHLGTRVSISPYVRIYTGTHQLGPGSKRMAPAVAPKPVVIEDGCWIGVGALILPGVTVGHGAVVGAGAVVMRDVPPNAYVEGNPAQVIRELPWGNR
jgi:acetyltransferase-like isoleucine patch superfamily enzyme